jgi:hypothetical protein
LIPEIRTAVNMVVVVIRGEGGAGVGERGFVVVTIFSSAIDIGHNKKAKSSSKPEW